MYSCNDKKNHFLFEADKVTFGDTDQNKFELAQYKLTACVFIGTCLCGHIYLND